MKFEIVRKPVGYNHETSQMIFRVNITGKPYVGGCYIYVHNADSEIRDVHIDKVGNGKRVKASREKHNVFVSMLKQYIDSSEYYIAVSSIYTDNIDRMTMWAKRTRDINSITSDLTGMASFKEILEVFGDKYESMLVDEDFEDFYYMNEVLTLSCSQYIISIDQDDYCYAYIYRNFEGKFVGYSIESVNSDNSMLAAQDFVLKQN